MKKLKINAAQKGSDFNHYWKKVVASSNAHTVLRKRYLDSLTQVSEKLGFEEVRFHGIFTDSLGVYAEDEDGSVKCNFYQVDEIYDSIIERGMRPFIELGFMPKELRSTDKTVFFWKGNISLPNNEEKYREMIRQFITHLVERYGIDEVKEWKFEVWNEPNLGGFNIGGMEAYFALYRMTAPVVREVNPLLKVGGPSTARCAWIEEMIEFCDKENLPLDFITTHLYRQDEDFGDCADWVAGSVEEQMSNSIPDYIIKSAGENFCQKSFEECRRIIKESSMPELKLYFTEFGAFWEGEAEERDSEYSAAFMCQSVFEGDGLLDGLGYWTFSDDFEELGVTSSEFSANFGMITRRGLYKPVFNAFQMMNRLGHKRLEVDGVPCYATYDDNGKLSVLIWNETRTDDSPITINLEINGLSEAKNVSHFRIDRDHSNAYRAWQKIGCPASPTSGQITELKKVMDLEKFEDDFKIPAGDFVIKIELPSHGVSLLEFR